MKAQERDKLLQVLEARFHKNMQRHEGLSWPEVQARLMANGKALESLQKMEASGGEPDVIGQVSGGTGFTFCDCSPETPSGRRSVCYDGEARLAR